MRIRRRTPLARLNLTHNWRRLLAAVGGIGFAVVLMFVEIGFNNALFDSTVKVIDDLNADLILASASYNSLISGETFPRERILQARGCAGVKGAYPFYIQLFGAMWQGPGRTGYPIRVLACDVSQPIFRIPEVAQHAAALEAPGAALFDMKSKKQKYGVPDSSDAVLEQTGAELNGQAIHVVGVFEMGADFACDGNVILSELEFARYCPDRAVGRDPLSVVDLGVVQLDDPGRASQVQANLSEVLRPEVKVWTKEQFIAEEKEFLNENTGIGFIFQLGKWIGFLVGVVICYQIIHADISDHTNEFATLKAMGYGTGFFLGLVMKQAMYLSLLGFVPGLLASAALYRVLASVSGLLMELNGPRAVSILLLTAAMCAVSGCLAMRKILDADPADLY